MIKIGILAGDKVVWTVYRLNAVARLLYEGIGGRYIEDLNQMYLNVQRHRRMFVY